MSDVENCINCKNLKTIGPSHDQPHLEIWCSKGIYDGISNEDELYEDIECVYFDRATKFEGEQ